MAGAVNPIDVYLELGTKRTFAGAIDWPGWCRSGAAVLPPGHEAPSRGRARRQDWTGPCRRRLQCPSHRHRRDHGRTKAVYGALSPVRRRLVAGLFSHPLGERADRSPRRRTSPRMSSAGRWTHAMCALRRPTTAVRPRGARHRERAGAPVTSMSPSLAAVARSWPPGGPAVGMGVRNLNRRCRKLAVALPQLGIQPHQRTMHRLVRRLAGEHALPRRQGGLGLAPLLVQRRHGQQQREILLAQRFPPPRGPVSIGILRQQVTRVALDGRPVGRRGPDGAVEDAVIALEALAPAQAHDAQDGGDGADAGGQEGADQQHPGMHQTRLEKSGTKGAIIGIIAGGRVCMAPLLARLVTSIPYRPIPLQMGNVEVRRQGGSEIGGFINKIKWFRRISSRFERLAGRYLGFLGSVATVTWMRCYVNRTHSRR